jgi:glutathione S-transferase
VSNPASVRRRPDRGRQTEQQLQASPALASSSATAADCAAACAVERDHVGAVV